MKDGAPIPPLDGSIIRRVVLVDQVTRTVSSPFQSNSLPGHLIQLVTEGSAEWQNGGVKQAATKGDCIWFYENETVVGQILKAPFRFYTISLIAPTLLPPGLDQRVRPVGDAVREKFRLLLDIWRDFQLPPALRHIQVHALILNLLIELVPDNVAAHHIDSPTRLWWDLESRVRSNLAQPIDLAYLSKVCGCSPRSIIRACHAAVGMTPIKRIKKLRLSYAQGLVVHTRQAMTDIAMSVGYGRVQEFSRDYRKSFGVTPTQDRKAGPRYQQLETPKSLE